MIEVNNISFYYNKDSPFQKLALDDVSFKINKGDCLGIVGPSSSGKSTIAQLLNGLLKPFKGSIIIDGEEITKKSVKFSDLRKKVGLAFQFPEDQLFEETVLKDVVYGIRNYTFSENEIKEKILNVFKLVNLNFEKTFYRSPFELSGGEKRKVALAGIFIMDPIILILDEPTAGLDPVSNKETFTYIEKLNKINKKTIIIISHNMEVILKLCNKVLGLKNGRNIFFGFTKEIIKQENILRELSLKLPPISLLLNILSKKNFNIKSDLFSPDEAALEILDLYKMKS